MERGVWRGDLWGKRLDKYRAAAERTFKDVDWLALEPVSPFYQFTRQDAAIRNEYESGWLIAELFQINVLGFQTHRDDFAISFTKEEMQRKLREITDVNVPESDVAQRCKLNISWVSKIRRQLQNRASAPLNTVTYRPFDNRWTEYTPFFNDRPRRELIDHVVGRRNILLGVGRAGVAVPERPWELALVSEFAVDANVFRRGGISLSPLYMYRGDSVTESITPDFRNFLDAQYEHHYTGEEILGYLYAVLHAPTFRARYAEFLHIDFPRVPFPESADDFEKLSNLGWALVQAHLLRELPRRGLAAYPVKGDHTVEAVRYSPEEQAIAINKTQFFKPVPQAVWEFHIGGYQVLDKYLKSRKGRVLSLDEINHVGAIADSLAFTIEQMAKIDEAYKAAFVERG